MADFNLAIGRVLQNEGGLCNDSGDPGGLTNFGISQRAYPDIDIRNLTQQEAKDIYKKDYWDANNLGSIIDQPTAGKLLDMAVNMGSYRMGMILQQALTQDFRCAINVDGKIGPETIKASNQQGIYLLQKLRNRSVQFYEDLVQERPEEAKFLNDWLQRARQ